MWSGEGRRPAIGPQAPAARPARPGRGHLSSVGIGEGRCTNRGAPPCPPRSLAGPPEHLLSETVWAGEPKVDRKEFFHLSRRHPSGVRVCVACTVQLELRKICLAGSGLCPAL